MLPPSEGSLPHPAQPGTEADHTPDYTCEERTLLLHIAHQAILAHLEGRDLPPFTPSPHLSEAHGVFTTLYLGGKLRGCVGYPTSLLPLYRAVMETAWAAAFDDPRFDPLTAFEEHKIRVSLSVLSVLQPVCADEVEV